MSSSALQRSCALWNRSHVDLESDEILAQILDRGELEAWRELYRLTKNDARLRRRIHTIVTTVPLPYPYFWLAALAALGSPVDYDAAFPSYGEGSI